MWKLVRCRLTGLRKPHQIPYISVRNRCCPESFSDRSKELNATKVHLDKYEFCKDIMQGKFDRDILTYPEVLDAEKVESVSQQAKTVEDAFHNPGKCCNSSADISHKYFNRLKDLNILSMRVPIAYGGEGYTTTEFTKIMETLGNVNCSMARTVCGHEAGLQPLIIHGTSAAKEDLLTALVSEKWLAALCVFETDCYMDFNAILASGVYCEEKHRWHINGQKKGVVNGPLAELFTVATSSKDNNLSVFTVKQSSGGIDPENSKSTLGARGCAISNVIFANTSVPEDNMLGSPRMGLSVVLNALAQHRFCVAASSLGLLKKLIQFTTEFASNKLLQGKNLKDFSMVSRKVADITLKTYVAESMVYLTAGILDLKENADCFIETSLIKVFVTEIVREAVNSFYELFGRNAFVQDFPFAQMLRDAQVITAPEDGNDFIRIMTTVLGIGSVGEQYKRDSDETRPLIDIRKMLETQGHLNKSLGLPFYVHPTLEYEAHQLEDCVLLLKLAAKVLQLVPPKKVRENEIKFCCLADVLINIYGMTAVIARASRSYSIGLPHSNSEVDMADTFCMLAYNEVKSRIKVISDRDLPNLDSKYQSIAAKLYDHKEYFIKNPFVPNL